MKLADFSIGREFTCGDRRWRCTDIGTRVVVAIGLDDYPDDPSWYNGPPYAVNESAFDEYDQEACEPIEREEGRLGKTPPPGRIEPRPDGPLARLHQGRPEDPRLAP